MQKVLLWISLCVLMLVTGGMAIIQQIHETDSQSNLRQHFSEGDWQYSLGRAASSAVAFFFVSFLTAPAPECLVPGSGIPSNAAWIVAVLLGSILALAALHGQQLDFSKRDTSSSGITQPLTRSDNRTATA